MLVDGVTVPHFLYGTAWKENKTKSLVTLALDQGFRGIDTANQRKHYNEAAVGEGIRKTINRGLLARKDLYIQTKFTLGQYSSEELLYVCNGLKRALLGNQP